MSEANAELGPVSLRSVFMVHLATYVFNERFFKCLILIYLVVNYLKYYKCLKSGFFIYWVCTVYYVALNFNTKRNSVCCTRIHVRFFLLLSCRLVSRTLVRKKRYLHLLSVNLGVEGRSS